MIPKQLEEITKADIDALLANAVPEGRTVEYKLLLPGNTDSDRKEFLADASSFANAGGGDLLFGANAPRGMLTDIPGLDTTDPDADIQRLDSMIQAGIEPRIPGIRTKAIDGFPQGPVLLVRIPQSWTSPHMVTFKGTSRFFTRNSAGKYQMDVTEIRAGFLMAEAIPERIRRFRNDRLSTIVAGETPLPMTSGAKVILHLFPVSGFSKAIGVDVVVASQRHANLLLTIAGGGHGCRMNMDGCVAYFDRDDTLVGSYVQLFRSGTIEAVDEFIFLSEESGIPSEEYERDLISATAFYLKLLSQLGVEPPIIAMLSMVGVKGFRMATGQRPSSGRRIPVIDRDVLLLPEVIFQNLSEEPTAILRPIFDAVWQSAGFTGSCNYNKDGKWSPRH